MKLGTQYMVCPGLLIGLVAQLLLEEEEKILSHNSVFFYFPPPPLSLVSCKIALKSSSKSITSSVIPPFKTNLLEKDLNRVETMEKLTKLTVNKQINL